VKLSSLNLVRDFSLALNSFRNYETSWFVSLLYTLSINISIYINDYLVSVISAAFINFSHSNFSGS
jgi:hypothetical protein